MIEMRDPEAFILAHTAVARPPLVPEIRLHLATEIEPIWRKTEEELAEEGLPPPFWAFAWAGGQALARYVLDHPEIVAGRRVLDFASGCGISAVAAMMAGAAHVLAAEVDAFAAAACALNAALNDVELETTLEDQIGRKGDWAVILAGDVLYEKPLAGRVETWLRGEAARGVLVIVGDPGRAYLPKAGLEALAAYEVETTRELEDREVRRTRVYRMLADPSLVK